MGGNTSLSANEMVKVVGGWVRKVKMVVDSGDGIKHGVAATKDVGGRVATVRAEPTACIRTVSARVCEHHIMGKRDDVETSVGRDPRRSECMIAEKVSSVRREQAHDRTLFIKVLTIGSEPRRRIDNHRVNLSRGGTRFDVERVVAIRVNAS